jgi:hypothetical protein
VVLAEQLVVIMTEVLIALALTSLVRRTSRELLSMVQRPLRSSVPQLVR